MHDRIAIRRKQVVAQRHQETEELTLGALSLLDQVEHVLAGPDSDAIWPTRQEILAQVTVLRDRLQGWAGRHPSFEEQDELLAATHRLRAEFLSAALQLSNAR